MTMMMNIGLTSLQRNGVIIKLIIDDVNVSLAMVIPQRPHHNSGDQDTDVCMLLRKEDSTKRFLCTVCQLSDDVISITLQLEMIFRCVFDHVCYVLLPERDDTIFVYRAPFLYQVIYTLFR